MKVNNILYIHKQSNHPQSITKKIPAMISKRKFDTTWVEECFVEADVDCNDALKNSGFSQNIKSTQQPPQKENAAETFYGLIHHLASPWRPTLAKYFYNS